jgi:hypothetical protein
MTEPERTPRTIERTLKPGQKWTIRNIESITISVEDRDANAKEVRFLATVIDKRSPDS